MDFAHFGFCYYFRFFALYFFNFYAGFDVSAGPLSCAKMLPIACSIWLGVDEFRASCPCIGIVSFICLRIGLSLYFTPPAPPTPVAAYLISGHIAKGAGFAHSRTQSPWRDWAQKLKGWISRVSILLFLIILNFSLITNVEYQLANDWRVIFAVFRVLLFLAEPIGC